MEIPVNAKRLQIEDCLQKGKSYHCLEQLGVKLLVDETNGAGRMDCMGYVLNKLGAPDEANALILGARRHGLAEQGKEYVVIYSEDSMQHVGLYKDLWVSSKWGRDEPVYKHRIIDSPVSWGNKVEFVEITDELKAKIQQLRQGALF